MAAKRTPKMKRENAANSSESSVKITADTDDESVNFENGFDNFSSEFIGSDGGTYRNQAIFDSFGPIRQ